MFSFFVIYVRIGGLDHDGEGEFLKAFAGLVQGGGPEGARGPESVGGKEGAESVLVGEDFDGFEGLAGKAELFGDVGGGGGGRVGEVADDGVDFQLLGELEDAFAVGGADIVVFVGEPVSGVVGAVVAGDGVVTHALDRLDGRNLEERTPEKEDFFRFHAYLRRTLAEGRIREMSRADNLWQEAPILAKESIMAECIFQQSATGWRTRQAAIGSVAHSGDQQCRASPCGHPTAWPACIQLDGTQGKGARLAYQPHWQTVSNHW